MIGAGLSLIRTLSILADQTGGLLTNNTNALDRAIDQFYTSDVFMHTWDLARATGQDDRLDRDFCALLLAGMEPMEEIIRSSGQYGPKVNVAVGADPQTKLLGFIGRDPFWTPTNVEAPK